MKKQMSLQKFAFWYFLPVLSSLIFLFIFDKFIPEIGLLNPGTVYFKVILAVYIITFLFYFYLALMVKKGKAVVTELEKSGYGETEEEKVKISKFREKLKKHINKPIILWLFISCFFIAAKGFDGIHKAAIYGTYIFVIYVLIIFSGNFSIGDFLNRKRK